MILKLSVSNDSQTLPSVAALVRTTLLQLQLPADDSESLAQLVIAAVRNAIENAYPAGEQGMVDLTMSDVAGKLDVRVRDYGLPQDVSELERRLHSTDSMVECLYGLHDADVVDEVHWLAFGSQGKELQLAKWLPTAHVTEESAAADLAPHVHDVPLAAEQQYEVRRMRSEEAVQVSQLMYRTYGNTYFNEDVYFPQRIASENLHDNVVSFGAVGEDGRVVGHCALERNQNGPVSEIGQAAVDPAHRGRGLLDRLKEALEKEARTLGLVGWYADAVAVHTFTQQSNSHHGGRVCGVDLAVSPKTEAFRNIAAQQEQRVSCVLYFHWLTQKDPRVVFVPPHHQEIVASIYENLQCSVEFGKQRSPTPETGMHTVKFENRAAIATIRADRLGKDSASAIQRTLRELVERSRAEVVAVELPLAQAATASVCEALEAGGVAFTGIGPHFLPEGDVLKLVYLVDPLTKVPIKTFEPFAERLVDYALAEQKRVRQNF